MHKSVGGIKTTLGTIFCGQTLKNEFILYILLGSLRLCKHNKMHNRLPIAVVIIINLTVQIQGNCEHLSIGGFTEFSILAKPISL